MLGIIAFIVILFVAIMVLTHVMPLRRWLAQKVWRAYFFYLPHASNIVALAFAFLLGASGIFLSLAQVEAFGSKAFSDELKHGKDVFAALGVYAWSNPWGFIKLCATSSFGGILSAMVFLFPIQHEHKARYVRFIDNTNKNINFLDYTLNVAPLGGFDNSKMQGFVKLVLVKILETTQAFFVIYSERVEQPGPESYVVAYREGWGGPALSAPDSHAMHFRPDGAHYVDHSGEFGKSVLGAWVNPPSIGAKVFNPINGEIRGILWISVDIDKSIAQPTERIIKMAANLISMAMTKANLSAMTIRSKSALGQIQTSMADIDTNETNTPGRTYNSDEVKAFLKAVADKI